MPSVAEAGPAAIRYPLSPPCVIGSSADASASSILLLLATEGISVAAFTHPRAVGVLTGMGVTVMMTSELEDRYTDLRFSSYGNAFLSDAIVMQRYVELKGQFRRVISVVKVRGSAHSKDIRFYDIDNGRIEINEPLSGYDSILSGHPTDGLRSEP